MVAIGFTSCYNKNSTDKKINVLAYSDSLNVKTNFPMTKAK